LPWTSCFTLFEITFSDSFSTAATHCATDFAIRGLASAHCMSSGNGADGNKRKVRPISAGTYRSIENQ
jgi:hypothetical protein